MGEERRKRDATARRSCDGDREGSSKQKGKKKRKKREKKGERERRSENSLLSLYLSLFSFFSDTSYFFLFPLLSLSLDFPTTFFSSSTPRDPEVSLLGSCCFLRSEFN